MSAKAWLVQIPSDSPMPFVQLMDWFEQTAKAQFLAGVNYMFYSALPPPEFQMKQAFTIAFTTEGVLLMDTFPIDLTYHLHRLENLMNPFWHDESIFKKWYEKNAKGFADPNEVMSWIKVLEASKQNGK
jgi:hypothetical protein